MDIQELREKIREIDAQLVPLLAARMEVSRQVAEYKREKGIPVRDAHQEERVLLRAEEAAGERFALYVRRVYETVLEVSRSYQETLLGRK